MELTLATLDRAELTLREQEPRHTWQAEAIETYRLHLIDDESALRQELADRVGSLTGFRVAPSSVAVDRDARVAFVALDGVLFRLQRHEIVLLRPCAYCGTGEFASAPLETQGDLG